MLVFQKVMFYTAQNVSEICQISHFNDRNLFFFPTVDKVNNGWLPNWRRHIIHHFNPFATIDENVLLVSFDSIVAKTIVMKLDISIVHKIIRCHSHKQFATSAAQHDNLFAMLGEVKCIVFLSQFVYYITIAVGLPNMHHLC